MPKTHLHILAEAAPLLASLDLDEALAALERLVVPEIADWCAIHLVDDDGRIARVEVAHRDPARVAFALAFQQKYPPDPETSAVHRVIRTGTGLLMPELTDEMLAASARNADHLHDARALNIHSVITVPLKARGRTLGAMTLLTERGSRTYDEGWLSLAESVAALAALSVDNTRLYTELANSRSHFEAILHGVPEGITVQSDDGRLVYANDAAARSMGFGDAAALLATPPRSIIQRYEMLDASLQPLELDRLPGRRALAGEEAPTELVAFRTLPDGELRWSRVMARIIPGTRSGQHLAVNVIQDVTAHVEYERQLEQARAEAEQASAAKTQFLAVVSHELRTPLNAISGFTELLAMGVAGVPTAGQREYLQRIDASTRHLVGVIEQILTFSRIETGREDLHLEDVDLRAVVLEVAELIEPLAQQKALPLERRVPEQPVAARIDVPRTRQILINLVGNAIKFTDAGFVRVEVGSGDGFVAVSVVDSGPGIPPVERERIFEPFTQIDASATRRVGGTGLGLAVSRHLARLMGGEITVEREPEAGSRFTMRLPAGGPG